MVRQIFGIVKHIQMPCPTITKDSHNSTNTVCQKASVVGANTRPLDDGGLIIGFILFEFDLV